MTVRMIFAAGDGGATIGLIDVNNVRCDDRFHVRGTGGVFDADSYLLADPCVALTPYEASWMVDVFGAPTRRVHVVNNGVESVFLNSQALPRGPSLVCTAAIIEMKQVLKLAEIAVRAKTKLWVIGKAHSETD